MTSSLQEPPLVDVKVTNPVTYLRRWWDRVMGKEGVYFSFRIHPITAFLIAFGFATAFIGVGRYSINIPFLKYQVLPTIKPTTSAEVIWKETAFTGKLQLSLTTNKYFLITTSSEAITLDVPSNLDLITLVGKRIFAIGQYNKTERFLKVFDIKDLEVLPRTPVPIPTIEAIGTPVAEINSSAIPIPTDTIETQ